jgi:hypothetical protein
LDNAAFGELPLNSDDKQMKVVRKIQVTEPIKYKPSDTTDMMKEVFGILRPEPQGESNTDVDKAFEEIPESAKLNDLIDPSSTLTSVFGFDAQGRIVHARQLTDVGYNSPVGENDKESRLKVRIKGINTFNMTAIGEAKLIDQPTADNTVDGVEKLKSGLIGKILGKIFKPNESADASATDATKPEPPRSRRKSKRR